MPVPRLDEQSRKRPLCYDPTRDKYIWLDDIVAGRERIIPIDSLSEDEFKKLVIKRWRAVPENVTVQAMSGQPLSRDDVIQSILHDEPFGRMTLEAERSALRDLLDEIRRGLEQR